MSTSPARIARSEVIIEAAELKSTLETKTGIDLPLIFDATFKISKGEDPNFIDARADYLAARLPGAAFFDHAAIADSSTGNFQSLAPVAELQASLGKLGVDPQREIIVYCGGALSWATRAFWLLRYAGHTRVRVLNGGIAAWRAAGGAIESGEHTHPAVPFTGTVKPELFVGRERVEVVSQGRGEDAAKVSIVHTLATESYAEGHIAGASCLPSASLTDDKGTRLKADEELKAVLADSAAMDEVITYCGGGIAATVVGVAHLVAGNPRVSVYDGSLSEWKNVGLPLVSGK